MVASENVFILSALDLSSLVNFTSVVFFAFCSIVAIVYFVVPKQARWVILLIASYVFYWVSSGWLIFFILCATCITFLAGIVLDKLNLKLEKIKKETKARKDNNQSEPTIDETNEPHLDVKKLIQRRKTLVLVIVLLFDLAFLIVFKYSAFIAEIINPALSGLGLGSLPIESLVMPIGISFYTFQAIGYLVDMHRGKQRADYNPAKFALFLAFFPQIVQGPIGRHSALAHQLYEPHDFEYNRVRSGILLITYGLFKKLVIADRIGVFVIDVFDKSVDTTNAGAISLIAALFYGVQLYCDFSGGIDVARGFARILGINLAENFKRPYYACSLDEYWRRWHITLGEWMRDYLFYPILLSNLFQKFSQRLRSRFKSVVIHTIPIAIATFVVFMAVGIWHGAAWHWVAYAIVNATIIAGSVMLDPVYRRFHKATKIPADNVAYTLFMRIRTVLIRTIPLTYARASSLAQANAMITGFFTSFNINNLVDGSLMMHGLDIRDYVILILAVAVLWWVSLQQERGNGVGAIVAKKPFVLRWIIYIVSVVAIILLSANVNAGEVNFIYGRF